MTEEEIIKENIVEIGKILGIIKSQINIIDGKGRSSKEVRLDPVEEDIRTTVLYAKRSYLDFYKKIIEFIYDKLRSGAPEKDFFFYVPQLRVLIEIYTSLLYLCFQDEVKQMTVIVGETLFTIAKSDKSGKTKEVRAQYDLYYKSYKKFIEREGLTFPEGIELFSSNWFRRSGYEYPPVDQMLKEEWIRESSPQLTARSGGGQGNTYVVYGHLSNYVHGNVLVKDHHGNEMFWVISEVLILSGRIAELVSVKILNNSQKKDIENWIKTMSISYGRFQTLWLERGKKL